MSKEEYQEARKQIKKTKKEKIQSANQEEVHREKKGKK
eukprot:CAMPEP_0170559620 /NCGR_PEP_ID=MMETSP0211-20121228/44004_1 /TAXON_ID=311385 /ORGANISM="Pseudokeronopsis sp., Strain OXSARD2" /LENGTH=37 /DNA_ID= /DNA_START= /DNA_END= /DNA_ORIENTATION=